MQINNTIYSKLAKVLANKFGSGPKTKIKSTHNTLRCACPYCGDSSKNIYAKRGNVYLDSGKYHCYNCGKHTSILTFFKHFNENLSTSDKNIVQQIINETVKKNISNFVDFSELMKYAIPYKKFCKWLGIRSMGKNHIFVKKRLLQHKVKYLGEKSNNIYLFNVVNGKLLGYQKKIFTKKGSYYKKYTLKKIYEQFFSEKKVDENILDKLNKVSLMYGFFTADFTHKVTLFEGVINSWFFNNSIAVSSVTTNTNSLDVFDDVRYFYDNDVAGKTKMIEKIKKGKEVFLWDAFLKKHNLSQHINDLNDLVIYLKKNKKLEILNKLETNFSSNILNSLYV